MAISESRLYYAATRDYIQSLTARTGPRQPPEALAQELFERTVAAVESANVTLPKSQRLKPPKNLTFMQIGELMLYYYHIRRISCTNDNADQYNDLLGVYQSDGPFEGIYLTAEEDFRTLARDFNRHISTKDFGELLVYIKDNAARAERSSDKDLIAVNNGIFDYKSKTLMPFDPERVFLAKSRVDYNPAAKNVVIRNPDDGTDWDVESWVADLTDSPAITNLIWQMLGAIIRPFVKWNKSAWLYSTSGNNGKGTLCHLMRNLCGDGTWASISISDFSKDFMLEPLLRANAVIVDENDVGAYIDKAANLKAVITNDTILINRKFKMPVVYQFRGFMVQCLNEFPKIKDKSDSFYRRQLFVPFSKCFTGAERRYIKDDYLNRRDVLEYVLFRVLNMDYYQLDEPDECREVLEDYKEFNDPVRDFMDEFSGQFVWDLLPFTFLYDLFKSWFGRIQPSGSVLGRNTFISDVINAVSSNPVWSCQGRKVPVRSAGKMTKPEPLIAKYNLVDWMNPNYKGPDIKQVCRPAVSANYRGLVRTGHPVDPLAGLTIDDIERMTANNPGPLAPEPAAAPGGSGKSNANP